MPDWTGLSHARVPAKRSGLDLATKTPPPPPLQLLTSSLYISATAGRTLVRCLYGRQPQCTLVHCILYLCCVWHSTALLLLSSPGTVRPGRGRPTSRGVIHRYTQGSARLGTAHKYRLALCLKQGFGEDHSRIFPRDFLMVFLRK